MPWKKSCKSPDIATSVVFPLKILANKKLNFQALLDYINENGDKDYQDPNSTSLSEKERTKFKKLKVQGQAACQEMKNIANYIESKFDLQAKDHGKNNWLSGNGRKMRNYLWIQFFKKDNYNKNLKSSISFLLIKE